MARRRRIPNITIDRFHGDLRALRRRYPTRRFPTYMVRIQAGRARNDITLGTTDSLRGAMLFIRWLTGTEHRVSFDRPVADHQSHTSLQKVRLDGVEVGWLEATWIVKNIDTTTTTYVRCGTEEYRGSLFGCLGDNEFEMSVAGNARSVSYSMKSWLSAAAWNQAERLFVVAGLRAWALDNQKRGRR